MINHYFGSMFDLGRSEDQSHEDLTEACTGVIHFLGIYLVLDIVSGC